MIESEESRLMRLNRVLAMLALAVATGIGLIAVEGHNLRLQIGRAHV